MSAPIRVRQLLGCLNSVERAELKKLLPPKLSLPECETGRYPAMLLSLLPPGEQYSALGYITEELLRHPVAAITTDLLLTTTDRWIPIPLDAAQRTKLLKSKTTEPFLEHIRKTRALLEAAARGPLRYEEVVAAAGVEGHPDGRTDTQIFEVKMTGQLKQNWVDFLFQVFCYGALSPEVTDLYLVLPLQDLVWHADIRAWAKRAAFRQFLETAAAKKDSTQGAALLAQLLIAAHRIGFHVRKQKTLAATVASVPDHVRPYQFFLSGPQTTKMAIADADLAGGAAAVAATGARMFIHSQYLINLCSPPDADDDYHTALLIKNLQAGVAFGAKGVVVHVGKTVKQEPAAAMAHMRTNVLRALPHATEACPLLLETPAGQGTEVLRTWDEFVAFVTEINDPRLRICVDTCHVFACGHDPKDYISKLVTGPHAPLLRLVHFNDSATPCGSCVDRHAMVGQGHVGIETMSEVAALCTAHTVPMVIE